MFERFTERARQVVVLAQDEARALRHNSIGTEHLLLGLLREEEGIAARVLVSLGVTLEETRARVVATIGEGEEGAVVTGQIPFTPRAKNALELGLREALSLGHQFIGTEHLLLGLVRVDGAVGVEILEGAGVTPDIVREEVIGLLSGRRRPGLVSTPAMARPLAPTGRVLPPVAMLVTGWVLFAAALGVGVLVGWAIWG
jgi:ATP-dependent Clp protease ATP-binding subunit ClpC